MSSALSQGDSDFLAIKGEMAERVRRFDWTVTPLGPIARWPQSLKTAVGIVLLSPVPIVMLWGADGIMIYNDAYSVFAGGRHPQLLGSKVREGWPEVADFNDNVMRVGLAGGTLAYRDQELTLYRTGAAEQVSMDLDYSPILDESGRPAGVMAIVVETTERRRAAAALRSSDARHVLLLDLVQAQRETKDPNAIMRAASRAVGLHLQADRVGFFEMEAAEYMAFGPSWSNGRLPLLEGARLSTQVLGLKYREAIRRGETLGVADSAEDFLSADSRFSRVGAKAVIAAPIVRDGRWQAGFFVHGAVPRDWTADEITLVREVADQTWDAVERARAEAALRNSEEQLRLATEAAEIGLWDVDVVTDTLYWPARVKAMFGISADVPVTMADFFAGLHPEDRDATAAAYAAATDPARRALYDVEYRTVGKEDGVVRWVAAKGRGVFDAEGRCLRVIGTALDVTARKTIERRLYELNETLERRVAERTAERDRVWQNSRDLLVIASVDGVLRAVNPAWEEILGHLPDDVVGRHFLDFVWPEDAAASQEAMATAATAHELTGFENRFRHRDGTARWISWHTSTEGDLIFAYGRDITTAKAQAKALADTEHALRQAQKMEAVGQLTGGIAHDFNNLLQGVAGSLDLIRRKPGETERVRHWAEAGLKAAERGAKLTAQLLAFSRAQKLELRSLDVAGLVAGMRELLERTLGPATRVVLDLEEERSNVLGDETQLELAVLNLAINARDAMPNGGELRIAARSHRVTYDAELSPGDYVALSIADSGSGMAPDVLARAFDPFFTTKGVGKGTGLGLSQVYGMARQAGGTARIQSAPSTGTTVTLFLRRTAQRNVLERANSDDAAILAEAASATILIVDDDPDVRRFLAQALGSLNYTVAEAENGEEGLTRLAQSPPDLLVVDYAMPGMTGADFARAVRRDHPDLPILFATGYAETAAIDHVVDSRTTILRKPFRVSELQRAVTRMLRR